MYGSAPAAEDDDKPFAEVAAPYVAEFVGTYLLVFAIAVNSILAEPWGPTAVGALLVVLVYIFGPISGAYLNPAVSVAAGLAGQIPWRTVMAYTVLQITAGFIAGLACYGAFQMRMGVAPVAPFQFWEAAFLELLFTTMLVFVILSVTASRTGLANNSWMHISCRKNLLCSILLCGQIQSTRMKLNWTRCASVCMV